VAGWAPASRPERPASWLKSSVGNPADTCCTTLGVGERQVLNPANSPFRPDAVIERRGKLSFSVKVTGSRSARSPVGLSGLPEVLDFHCKLLSARKSLEFPEAISSIGGWVRLVEELLLVWREHILVALIPHLASLPWTDGGDIEPCATNQICSALALHANGEVGKSHDRTIENFKDRISVIGESEVPPLKQFPSRNNLKLSS
jgi:hypothetical protein